MKIYLKNNSILLSLFLLLLLSNSCKKGWLEKKPNISMVTPISIADYQAILDNSGILNKNYPNLGEVSADNFSVTYSSWLTGIKPERNAYIWNIIDMYEGRFGEWDAAYNRILYSNVVLKGIEEVYRSTNPKNWDNVKGSALFFRAMEFYNLSQYYTKAYDPKGANEDLGIPMPLTPDVKQTAVRSTVKNIYHQIFSDLKTATALLPSIQIYRTRPSKTAAYALLARAYLNIEDYEQAFLYADSCLLINNKLMNFNTLNYNTTYKIPQLNDEIIFQASIISFPLLELNTKILDESLYNSYHTNDLRKRAFFNSVAGNITFTGSYLNAERPVFGGIATDEIYLIKAECLARESKIDEALAILNDLMKTRWVTNAFIPFTANTVEGALKLILSERRKELIFRGLRWSDLRRLNRDSRFAVTLTRTLNAVSYTLEPNSPRYTFPIPPDN